MKKQEWSENEFVNYEEYAEFGISGDMYCKNLDKSIKKGVPNECMCPLCAKELKEGSYRLMIIKTAPNGTTNYFFNPNVQGQTIKVGNGCYKNLMKAYKEKYKK